MLVFQLRFEEYRKFIDYAQGKTIYRYGDVVCGDGKVSKYSAFFNGDSNVYLKAYVGTVAPQSYTWSAWLMKNVHNPDNYPIFMSFGLPYVACNGSTSPFRLSYTSSSGQSNLNGTTIPVLNTWYHVAAVSSGSHIKLYVNGIEEASSTTVQTATSSTDFEIGRHRGGNTYRMWGRVDDVRLYDEPLTPDQIYDMANSANGVTFHENGDVTCAGLEEDVDWDLLDNFISSLDNGITPFDSAIGGTAINSYATLDAAGWTRYLTTIDTTSYTRVKGYSQQYYSSSPIGYIRKNLPAGYDRVRVYWGNWHGGTARIRMDGTIVKTTFGAGTGRVMWASEYSGTPLFQIEEAGIYWISDIWVGKSKSPTITMRKHRSDISFYFNRLSPNEHDYSSWTVGSGSVGNFSQNGDTAENVRGWGDDPWGQPTIVWGCYPDAVSGADGGWVHTAIPIDNTKMYRYSCWVLRNHVNDGRFYHGCNGYGSTNGVLLRSSGANSTNPYFYHSITGLPIWEWCLVVGHIWPVGSGTGGLHSNSGIYYANGGSVGSITNDYVWRSETTTGRGRNYLFYTTNTAQRQWLVYPMFEICDGTEATIGELISGAAYCRAGRVQKDRIEMGLDKQRMKDGTLYTTGRLLFH